MALAKQGHVEIDARARVAHPFREGRGDDDKLVEREHVQLSHVANARWIEPGIVAAMYARPAMAPAMCAS